MLSWKLHPDNFVRASEFERNLSLQRSSELNDAYRTLREPLSRVEYLLEFLNVRKEGTTKQQAPPELLEEVFELNESLDELREARAAGGDVALLRGRLDAAAGNFQAKLTEVDAELAALGTQWDAALDAGADEAKRSGAADADERGVEPAKLHPQFSGRRAAGNCCGVDSCEGLKGNHGQGSRNRFGDDVQPGRVHGRADWRAEDYSGAVRLGAVSVGGERRAKGQSIL